MRQPKDQYCQWLWSLIAASLKRKKEKQNEKQWKWDFLSFWLFVCLFQACLNLEVPLIWFTPLHDSDLVGHQWLFSDLRTNQTLGRYWPCGETPRWLTGEHCPSHSSRSPVWKVKAERQMRNRGRGGEISLSAETKWCRAKLYAYGSRGTDLASTPSSAPQEIESAS